MLNLGCVAALTAVIYLFGTKSLEAFYIDIWLFFSLVYVPVLALRFIPETLDVDEADCRGNRRAAFILEWVLVPLGGIYLVILYTYIAKIALLWELPRGGIAYMVAGLAGVGIITFLCGWVRREDGNALVRYLYKHFMSLLIVPSVLLGAAVFYRIGQYGITQDRYVLSVMALWLFGISLYYTVRPKTSIRYIVLSLMTALFFTSFGPWGVTRTSENSQRARLEYYLSKNNMLKDGVAVAAQGEVSRSDKAELSSIVDFFVRGNRGHKIQQYFPTLSLADKQSSQTVLEFLKLEYVPSYQRQRDMPRLDYKQYVVSPSEIAPFADVTGYDLYFDDAGLFANDEGYAFRQWPADNGKFYAARLENYRDVIFSTPDQGEFSVPLMAEVEKLALQSETQVNKTPAPIVLTATQGDAKVRFFVTSMAIRQMPDKTRRIVSLNARILYKR